METEEVRRISDDVFTNYPSTRVCCYFPFYALVLLSLAVLQAVWDMIIMPADLVVQMGIKGRENTKSGWWGGGGSSGGVWEICRKETETKKEEDEEEQDQYLDPY